MLNKHLVMQGVNTVDISVYPDAIKDILRQLSILKQEAIRIEAEFRTVGRSFDSELRDVQNLVKVIEQELGNICMFFSRSCNFAEYTISEYLNAEMAIKNMYDRVEGFKSKDSQRVGLSKSKQETNKSEMPVSKVLNIGLKIEPCKIYKKEVLMKYKLKPGKIEDGKNILVRTWKSPSN